MKGSLACCITRIDRVKVVVVMSLVFHQISDYRRLKSMRTSLGASIFGGSFSLVHLSPAQKVVVHERLLGLLYNKVVVVMSLVFHQISDYRRLKSMRTSLGASIFGGSFSLVHLSPAQKVVVHERLGGMLYNSNRAGQSGCSNVACCHQVTDYGRPKSTWTRLQRNPFGDPHQ